MIGISIQNVFFCPTEKLQIAPSGVEIPQNPTYQVYMENGCGSAKQFWRQDYVKKIVHEVQNNKKSRQEGAKILGVKIPNLVHQVQKLNEADGLSEMEKIRQENIAERMKLFQDLNIIGMKKDYIAEYHTKKPSYQKTETVILRPKSTRVQKMKLMTAPKEEEDEDLGPIPNVQCLKARETLSLSQNR